MNRKQKQIIHVAILSSEPIGWGSGKDLFPVILDNYTWTTHDTTYQIQTKTLYDRDIIDGRLTIESFDVLLVPGGGVGDGEAIIRGITFSKKTKKWKKNISTFIENGGGYVGICGGAALMTTLTTENGSKHTLLERLYDKSAIGTSCIQSYYNKIAIPLFYPFQRRFPEHIGAAGYVFSFSPGTTKDGKNILSSGVPLDFEIQKDNPIFSDLPTDSLRMRWWGGPAFHLPTNSNRDIQVLASYPKEDISNNPKTTIHAWKYTGGIIGLSSGIIQSLRFIKQHQLPLKNIFILSYYFSKGWKNTKRKIILNNQNKAALISEIYPNCHKGRILLCSTHPEYMIWHGGNIKEVENNHHNCLANGLHQWIDIDPLSQSAVKELTYTWWLVRRMVSWAGKTPDADMPPIESEKQSDEIHKILQTRVYWNNSSLNQIQNI